MNNEQLSEILGEILYMSHNFPAEQINEVKKNLDYLIEKDTPIPIGFKKDVGENGGVISEYYTCPRCEKDIYEEEQRYCDFCGQRLKWGE